jgi:hypothetical protein
MPTKNPPEAPATATTTESSQLTSYHSSFAAVTRIPGHAHAIDPHLAMLADITDLAIILPPHDALGDTHILADMHHLALDQQLGALGRGTQVGAVKGPADVPRLPETLPGAHGDGERGAHVEDEGDGAAVQVPAGVA